MLDTVKVPKQFEPIFQKAQEFVSAYFKKKIEEPSKGTIEIFGERYIFIRAASMSVDFFETVKNLYKDTGEKEAVNVARSILFDIAHAIGKADAKNFHKKMGLEDPIEKLSAGPVHFSHSGWAFVDIFPESKPSPDENYYLIYDHPFSFESDAWEKVGKRSDFPVCVMNSGYSSGWCEESFGITLVASEILCKAKGDEVCRFIMAHPSKIEDYIKEYLGKEPGLAKKVTSYEIPGFFKRKQMEEALRRAREELEIRVQERTTELAKANPVLQVEITERKKAEETLQQTRDYLESLINYANALIIVWDTNFKITRLNRAFEHLTGYSVNEVIGQELRILFPEATRDELMNKIALTLGGEYWESVEIPILCKDGNIRLVLWNSANIYTEDRKTLLATIAQGTDITERKKAEDALRASEAKYRLLTENLSQKIFLKDRNSVYLSCNENYARDLKIEAEEIKGKTDYDFYPKDLVEKYRADDKRIMDSGKAEEIEEKYIQDGREIVVHTVKTPIKDEQGNVIGILGIFWDITERKKAEEQQRLLMKDLEETNRIMTGRELRMIELKKEVNKLSEELGRPKPYEI